MFKLIERLIGIIIIGAIVFLALSLWQGGKPFRWLGRQSEQAGEVVREKSNQLAEDADKIRKKTDNVTVATRKVTDGIRKAGEKIRDLTGPGDRK
jgi:surface antigen